MSSSTGYGDVDSTGGTAWVHEHGAHLVDYASYRVQPARAVAAVASALRACAMGNPPENITDRAWLLSAVRRECAAEPNNPSARVRVEPGPGPPDGAAVRNAWTLVDPAGAEALRLLYRHELSPDDLAHVLALSSREVGKLIARTQDMVEILVSGLDGLARGRPICRELAPLVAAVFPDGRDGIVSSDAARTALLTHIVTCQVCKRPINIRYTVPQILSHSPISVLTDEIRSQLLDAVRPETRPTQPYRPPASFGMPLAAPITASSDVATPPEIVRPTSTRPETARADTGRADTGRVDTGRAAGAQPADSVPEPGAGQPVQPEPKRGSSGPAGAPPWSSRGAGQGQDTPLYNALLSQIQARETRTRSEQAVGPPPSDAPAPRPLAGPESPPDRYGRDQYRSNRYVPHRSGPDRYAAEQRGARRREPYGAREKPRPDEVAGTRTHIRAVLMEIGSLIRATAIRLLIVIVAGAAGTVVGINFLAPMPERPPGSRVSYASQTTLAPSSTATAGTAAPLASTAEQPLASGTDGGAPAAGTVVAGGIRVRSVVVLDDFGQGSITLETVAATAVKWRLSAQGFAVTPSSGVLKPGQTAVISIRALRVRYWCGVPPSVTAPLVVHTPNDSGTTTVRWRTC